MDCFEYFLAYLFVAIVLGLIHSGISAYRMKNLKCPRCGQLYGKVAISKARAACAERLKKAHEDAKKSGAMLRIVALLEVACPKCGTKAIFHDGLLQEIIEPNDTVNQP